MQNIQKFLDRSTSVWVRPGVIFWNGKNGSFMDDDLTKQRRKINSTAYFVLQNCYGQTIYEIIEKVKLKFKEHNNQEEDVIEFLTQLKNDGLIIDKSPRDFINYSCKTDFPLGLVFCELTHSCNFRCLTCYNCSGEIKEQEMSTLQWKIALEKIASVNPETQTTVIFTGGEPLLRRDFFEIASHAKSLGLYIQLFTNGSFIDSNTAQKIADLKIDYVRISVDGASPEKNDVIRGKGNFEKAINAMKLLTKLKVKVCWQSVISQINFNEMDKMLESAIALGLDGFRISSLDPQGRGENIKDFCLSPKQEYHLWAFLEKAAINHGNEIKIGWGADYCIDIEWKHILLEPQIQSINEIEQDPEILKKYMTNSMCGVGLRSFLITPSGDIALCPLLTSSELRMGNVLKDDLADIWLNGKALRILRETSLEEFSDCKFCGFRYSCVGGCRGLAYLSKNQLTACDPKKLGGLEYFADNFKVPVLYKPSIDF